MDQRIAGLVEQVAAKSKPHYSKDQEVEKFLQKFAKAFTAGDGKAVAELWSIPALVVGDEMIKAVQTKDEVAKFFGGAKGDYNKQGITSTYPDIIRLEWVTDRLAVVDVRWPYVTANGDEQGEEISTYTLRLDDNGELKLVVSLMHGARTEVKIPHS